MPTTLITISTQQARDSTNIGTGGCTVPNLLNTKSQDKLNVGHRNHTANKKIRHDNGKAQIKFNSHKLTEINKSVLRFPYPAYNIKYYLQINLIR
jgi:hypothetical protein